MSQMNKSPQSSRGLKTLRVALERASAALPSAEEKESLARSCQDIIEFFSSLRAVIGNLPTADEAKAISEKVSAIDEAATAARNKALFGLRRQTSGPRRQTARIDNTQVDSYVAKLKALSPEEVRRTLADESAYSVSVLRAIASRLGVGDSTKSTRPMLVSHISKKLENYRGYQHLAGEI